MRTSISEPLKKIANFRAFWDDVFDARHALVPDIQNSDSWRRKLLLAQKHILLVKGEQGGGITCALRHLSYAKQRIDSATGPARKFCCLLAAIVILLAVVASDDRLKPEQRVRAQKLLDEMTPGRITTAGLFADYMAESSIFFRHYEKTDHDIALSFSHKTHFLKRIKVLFKDGFVLADLSTASAACPTAAAGAASPTEETCTHIAISQAISFGTMRYRDRSITLWPEGAKEDAEASLATMANVVDLSAQRVEAEMPMSGLVCSFVAFDLHAWARIRRGKRDHRARAVETQKTRALRLVRAFPAIADVDGTADALCALAETLSASLPAASGHEDGRDSDDDAKSNRRLWGHALYHDRCSGELPKLVHWYVSILDNTGVVRGLSRHHCCWLDCFFSRYYCPPFPRHC